MILLKQTTPAKYAKYSIMTPYITNLLILVLTSVALPSFAHSGGRDTNGGHVDKSTGLYHCHTESCVNPDVTTPPQTDSPDSEPDNTITVAESWSQAKQWARDIIYQDVTTTFYCGCSFTPSGESGGEIDESSCSYDGHNQKNAYRAGRLEWEHVVPASIMPARSYQCWNKGLPECDTGGRACCEQHDPMARIQIFDLHNLVPSVGQVNALRSNKRYGIIAGEVHQLGACDIEWSDELTEPSDQIRGDVARIWLYYVNQHGLQLNEGELEMYTKWSHDDPPSDFELIRNARIRKLQGNGNPYVEVFAE